MEEWKMKTSFNGIGMEHLTAATAAESADEGKVCRAAADGSVTVCAKGEGFFGVLTSVRSGAACVQLRGYVELPYTGTAPTVGWCALAADANGGVAATSGAHEFLVLTVDTTAKTVGLYL
jgi:hypothetical protein